MIFFSLFLLVLYVIFVFRYCRREPHYFIFDTETSGLPIVKNVFTVSNECRMIEIGYIVADKNLDIMYKGSFLIKPETFEITNTEFHGISHETAKREGYPIKSILSHLKRTISECKVLVAHNIPFDVKVLCNEYLHNNDLNFIRYLCKMDKYCTMDKGKVILGHSYNPSLDKLSKELKIEKNEVPHRAYYDAHQCYKCFVELMAIEEKQRI